MQTYFVRVECDVTAKAHEQPFRYRAYVNDELFAERTWTWENCYLKENFQIAAPAGIYPIRFETVDADHGQIKIRDFRVVAGPGRIIEYQGQTAVEIANESK
jgi:hypothetical protein